MATAVMSDIVYYLFCFDIRCCTCLKLWGGVGVIKACNACTFILMSCLVHTMPSFIIYTLMQLVSGGWICSSCEQSCSCLLLLPFVPKFLYCFSQKNHLFLCILYHRCFITTRIFIVICTTFTFKVKEHHRYSFLTKPSFLLSFSSCALQFLKSSDICTLMCDCV